MHKFQVNNDKFHCLRILTTASAREIYHMDYSKNLSQMYKFATIMPL